MRNLGRIVAILFVSSLLSSGCNSPRQIQRNECQGHSDCGGDTPYCIPGQRICAECFQDQHCGCHQHCSSNVCVQLGASRPEQKLNAHGVWQGTPGESDYTYVKSCISNSDCDFGEICNPLTRGCIEAGAFQVSCSGNESCPPGPNGEVLICDPDAKRCRPTAVCRGDNNCCGGEALSCEPVSNACLPRGTQCTPPEDIESLSPFEPKHTAGCSDGRFCSPLGTCVQCLSTADCGEGLRCYLPNNACVSANFCTQQADCESPSQSCDTKAMSCAPRCTSDDDCVEVQYCNADSVCRPRDELPCQFDEFDNIFSGAEGNESPEQALNNGAALPVPEEVGGEVTMDNLSLCSGDIDWYIQTLQKGDEITIHGTSLDGLSATLTAFGPNASEVLGEGMIADSGATPLVYVANFDATYFVRVESFMTSTGTYRLRIGKGEGEVCQDPFEDLHGTNMTPQTATVLNDQALFPSGDPVPAGCTLEGNIAASHTIACVADALALCVGDIDFFRLRVPAGADLQTTLSAFSGQLHLFLYGPFYDDADVTDDAEFRLAQVTNSNSSKTVSVLSRLDATYLVEVRRFFGDDTTYNLVSTISTSPTQCIEDIFDAEEPGSDWDHPGLNDLVPTRLVADAGGNTLEYDLNLCRGDVDRFQLGSVVLGDEGEEFANLPANWRVQIDVEVAEGSPSDQITVAAGTTYDTTELGSNNVSQPQTSIFVERTTGDPLYVVVRGAATAADIVEYTLRVSFIVPPTCSADDYEPNDAPAFATNMTPSPWSDVGDTFLLPEAGNVLNACADDDWIRFDLPADTRLLTRLYYDPAQEVNLGLALYSSSVSELDTVAGGEALGSSGRFDMTQIEGAGMLRAFGGNPGQPVYVQVYNRSGWPLFDYAMDFELIPATCVPDQFGGTNEGTNGFANAAPLTLTRETEDRQYESVFLDWLTVCSSGVRNWFSVDASPGDVITSRVFYKAGISDLDLFLHRPNQLQENTYVSSDSSKSGLVQVGYTVTDNDPAGPYYLRVQSFHVSGGYVNGSYYSLEVRVRRACVDDEWAADTPGEAFDITDFVPFANEELQLCRDDDWFSFDLSGGENLVICKESDYGEADLDIYLHHGNQENLVAFSAGKLDREKISLSAVTAGTYYLHVAQDDSFRPLVNIPYSLSIGINSDPCP